MLVCSPRPIHLFKIEGRWKLQRIIWNTNNCGVAACEKHRVSSAGDCFLFVVWEHFPQLIFFRPCHKCLGIVRNVCYLQISSDRVFSRLIIQNGKQFYLKSLFRVWCVLILLCALLSLNNSWKGTAFPQLYWMLGYISNLYFSDIPQPVLISMHV